ncbi:MAG TPA: PA2169 family four-helix-bundle protein [Cyclobacteriaceae bacterium]|nr:PA2169 family four-helix-bundle protein [Cyclobacteriaceae bacterium]
MKTPQELASQLNDVLERNYDAINGYKDAARDVENEALKDYLIKQAKERIRFGQEMRQEIMLLGGAPTEEGSALGFLHRTWMNFKTNLVHNNEDEVCEECIRGEKAAVEEYDELLEEPGLSARLRAELLEHKTKTLQAIADLSLIRDAFK